jgi:DNA-binding MarR family transcriptional regulator
MNQPTLTDLGCACASARQVARILTQLYDARLRETGLEAPQFALLMTLRKEGPCTQAAIGRRYGLEKTTVSRNLKLMQGKGWIASNSANDKRMREVSLTPAGRKLLMAALPHWKQAQAELRSQMTGPAWDAMFTAFQSVSRAAQTLQIDPK